MSIGELKITANSQQAIQATAALDAQFQKTAANMQRGMEKAGQSADSTGTKWTELASKLTVLGTVARTAIDVFDRLQQSAKERGVLFSQFGENADIGAAKLMKYSAAVDYMINANSLMRSSNALVNGDLKVSEDRFESITKAAVQFARASGEDVNTVLKRLTDSINAGTTRGLKPFGIQLDDTGTKAQKSERILAELHKRFKEIKITVGDAAEDMDKFKNKTKMMELVGGDAIERMVRKYQKMKLASVEWVADAFNVSTVQLYAQKMNEANDKILTNNKYLSIQFEHQIALQNILFNVGRDTLNNGQRRREIADEMVKSINEEIVLLKGNYERQKLITDYAAQTGQHYKEHKASLDFIKERLDYAVKKQANWTQEAQRTGGAIGKIFGFAIEMTKQAVAAGKTVVDNVDEEVKRRKKSAEAYAKLSDEEKLNIKMRLIAKGSEINLTLKELFLLNKISQRKSEGYKEHEEAIKFNNKLTDKQIKREQDSYKENAINFDLQGKFLNEKNRLEKLYQDELDKGRKADVEKLMKLNEQIGALKNLSSWQGKLNKHIQEQSNIDYTGLIVNEQKILDLRQLQAQRDLAIKQSRQDVAVATQKNIDLIFKEAEGTALNNLAITQRLEKLQAFPAVYGNLANSQSIEIEQQKLMIELAKAKKAEDLNQVNAISLKIEKLNQEKESIGEMNLKLKEWEQSSYGAMGALKNVWQQSADAILMTDAQLKKAGKTRAQVIKEAVQAQILALGKQNLFEGGTNLAKGFGALAMGNPAAAGFFKSAGIHFAVAAAAGIGNSLFGAGGGGGEKKEKTAPTSSINTTNQSSNTYVFNIPNGLLFGSVDDLARGMNSVTSDAQRRGQI